MEYRQWSVYIHPMFPGRGHRLYFYRDLNNPEADEVETITEFKIERVSAAVDHGPAGGLFLSRGDMQHLLDQLWRSGFRPSTEVGSEGERQALQNHLKAISDINNRVLTLVERKWK